ncbi:myosin-10-like [Thunnus maccoyii]|uniref:myosin-10-like n=1 Tax=Thunnus maccoyii TaxID=8240 RepID=UPI001C4CD290|nr:myosin-10-like [Thunnus maccoyii]
MESASMLPNCETEEVLLKQEDELKAQVQTYEDKDKVLAAKLEDQNKEIESLRQQVKETNKALQGAKRECEGLHKKIKYLNGLVTREGAMRYQDASIRKGLNQQLNEVQRQLEEERNLKDKFMVAEKKARKEAERLQELHNVLSYVKSAQDEPEKTNVETLEKLEALTVEYSNSRERFAAQIKEEQDKNMGLQQELELIKLSYNEIKLKYETELKFEKEKSDNLQKELQQERRSHAERISTDLELLKKLSAAKDRLYQQKEEEIRILQENASERESSFAKELEDLRSQLKELTSTNLKLTANVKAEDENSQDLQQETVELQVKVVQQEKEPLCDSQALELLDEVGVSAENLPTKTKKSSIWKRFRHLLGLKKRKRTNP